ncbi:MAG TPA: hypothetical protein VFS11_10230 [Gemmatimonadales bacterium]|nr:hypothetical protein [Gemmatimonadales bacterium]
MVPLAVARAWVEGWHLAGEHAFEASDGGPIRRAWRRQLALFEAAVRADERQRLIASDMATADHGRNER